MFLDLNSIKVWVRARVSVRVRVSVRFSVRVRVRVTGILRAQNRNVATQTLLLTP